MSKIQYDKLSLILYAIIFLLIGVMFHKYYVTKSEYFQLQIGNSDKYKVSMIDLKYIIISFTSIAESELKLKDIALLIGKIGKRWIQTKARIMKGDSSQVTSEGINIQSGETWENIIITLIQDIENINTVEKLHFEIPRIFEQLVIEQHQKKLAEE
jgi:hypothetical protein